MARLALEEAHCGQCGHAVRSHQPHQASQPRGHSMSYVGCMECECTLTMEAKLKAWGGR